MPGPSIERVERAWKSTLLSVTGVVKGGRGKEETHCSASGSWHSITTTYTGRR